MDINIIKLIIASIIPVIVAIIITLLDQKTKFKNIPYWGRQVIIGTIYGLLAILGTEWGIHINGAMVNCRDAAPMTAGLMFGGPAGIIAGIIGGVERWFAVAWGAGEYTRIACSISTIIAGFYAAGIRKFLLYNKKPTWGMALGSSFVIEVFHLTMVFITNIKDPVQAISVVRACNVPMLLANSLSPMLSCIVVTAIRKPQSTEDAMLEHNHRIKSKSPLFAIIQKRMLVVLTISILVASAFYSALQYHISAKNMTSLLSSELSELSNDIIIQTNTQMIETARFAYRDYCVYNKDNDLLKIATDYNLAEINIINKEGVITGSTRADNIGYDIKNGTLSSEFQVLLNGEAISYVQHVWSSDITPDVSKKYAAITIEDGIFQIGYDYHGISLELDSRYVNLATNRTIDGNGYIVIFDDSGFVLSASISSQLFPSLAATMKDISNTTPNEIYTCTLDNIQYYYVHSIVDDKVIMALYPVSAANTARETSVYVTVYLIILLLALLYFIINILFRKKVLNEIDQMTLSLNKISDGQLDEVLEVRSSLEFASLSDDINTTVSVLKEYIDEAKSRIDKELEFAKLIQESALPRTFPAFPNRSDIDIYAYMNTAKEVGGDFYDYYFTSEDTFNFLIADVSGKGIPAALFMMRAKSELHSLTIQGLPVNEVFTHGNNALCKGNDAGMFVTAWQGCINLRTGLVQFANGGHNAPLVRHANGKFEYYRSKVNLVLAAMSDMPYRINELQLEPGDTIFLYTDGVTEATSQDNELYGEERLLHKLNEREYESLKDICYSIQEDINEFIGPADQFDDITMVVFKYAKKYE